MQHVRQVFHEFDEFIKEATQLEVQSIFKKKENHDVLYTAIGNDPRFGPVHLIFTIDRPHIGQNGYSHQMSWDINADGESVYTTLEKKMAISLLHQIGADQRDLANLSKIRAQRLRKLQQDQHQEGEEEVTVTRHETRESVVEYSVRAKDYDGVRVRMSLNDSMGYGTIQFEVVIPAPDRSNVVAFDKAIAEANITLRKGSVEICENSRYR